MEASQKKRIRLLKVKVQPVFVEDDGEVLRELPTEPLVLSAEAWQDYPEKLKEEILRVEKERNKDN